MKKILLALLAIGMMNPLYAGLITKANTFSAGTIIDPSQVNTNFDDIYNEFNGSISNANISGSAAIVASKLDLATIAQSIVITNSGSTVLTLNNSSGSNDIFAVLDNGTTVFAVLDGNDVVISSSATSAPGVFLVHGNSRFFNVGDSRGWDIVGELNRGDIVSKPAIEASTTAWIGIAGDGQLHLGTNDVTRLLIQAGLFTFKDSIPQGWDISTSINRGDLIARPAILGSSSGDAFIGVDGSNELHLGVNNNSNLIIVPSGDVAIGTTTPKGDLHVTDGTSALGPNPNTLADQFIIETSGNTGMTIMTGTSSTATICFGDTDNSCISAIKYVQSLDTIVFNTSGSDRVTLLGNNFGITGCADPDHDLVIGGTGSGCDTGTFSEIDAGEATFAISSGRNLKKNISEVTLDRADIYQKILNTKVYDYDFKDRVHPVTGKTIIGGKNRRGLMADEFALVLPNRSTPTTLRMDDVIMTMWSIMQHLINENREQKTDLDTLKSRIETLEALHP